MSDKKKKAKRTSIGGQAVLEGVMMRGPSSAATAVRDQDGIIRIESERFVPAAKKSLFFRLPIVRGIISFFVSLFGGVKNLMRSAAVYGDGEPTKFEKWLSEKLKVSVMGVVSVISVLLGLALAIFLFIWLPQFVRGLIEKWSGIDFNVHVWAKNFIEGGIKLLVFIGYILFCSLVKDVKRTFMYHGAEHKTITCFEKGLPLTVQNAKKCRRVHDRCGTTFIVFVMVISIILFAVFESILSVNGIYLDKIVRVLCKIAMLPLVAGLSYELLKALSKTNFWLFYPLKVPGLLLQLLTTKEPDDKMLEVAIAAFKEVEKLEADINYPTKKFVVSEKSGVVVENVYKRLIDKGIEERAEAEWIVSLIGKISRDKVYSDIVLSPKKIDKINEITEMRLTGRPLWYCIGNADFMGYTVNVDERVLIPRPETEILAEKAIEVSDGKKVLDLCTGSGAIAIAIKKEKPAADVFATDISESAISLAKENAENNGAEIKFSVGDLFGDLTEKFDVIVSNPPYIKSGDIKDLQTEVKDFEPIVALDGGEDGLSFYRRICSESVKYLNKGGILLLECGFDQAKDIIKLLKDFSSVNIIKDYEGIDRIVKAEL